jgi:hypothetical protein
MRPAFAIGIKDPIAIYNLVALVLEKGKVVAPGKLFLEFGDEFPGGLVAVDAHGQDLRVIFSNYVFQLAELARAIRSPVAAVKDQHDAFLAAVVGKRNILAVMVL